MDGILTFLSTWNFWSVVIGTVASLVTSWLVAERYFKRGRLHERITAALHGNLAANLIPATQPQFFTTTTFQAPIIGSVPANKDVPRLNVVLMVMHPVQRGTIAQILCSVGDDMFNFFTPGGLTVVDQLGRPYPVGHVGFGFMRIDIAVAQNDPTGTWAIAFHMRDSVGNTHTQRIYIQVV